MTIPAPRAILFDWDGTLVDTWGVISAALNETLVAHGQAPWTLAEAQERISQSQRDSFPTLFGERWEAARDLFYSRFEALHLEHLRVLPGAHELVALLAASDLGIAVVSNKHGPYLRKEAAHLGWDVHFTSIVGATDLAEDKPSAIPVHHVLEKLAAVAGPEIWFVGDSVTDVRCARAAGCTAILVRHEGANPTPLPEGEDADLVVDSLAAFAELLAAHLGSRSREQAAP